MTTRFRTWMLAGAIALLQGCAMLPPPAERPASASIPASVEDTLGRIAARSVPAGAGSGFRPLPFASYAMDARLTLARNAQKSLDLQYYHLENDLTGHTLLRAVRDAAVRGVRVRLLVDDLYTATNSRMLAGLTAYPNVEVRLFNPFPAGRAFGATRWTYSLLDFARVNHRMHNKMFIADGAFAIAGGRNIADEYFFSSKLGNFIDFDLLVAGDAVPRMADIFDIYWNSPRIYPLDSLEAVQDKPEALQAEFEKLTADAKDAFPAPPAGSIDMLGYMPLSADIARSPLKLMYGKIDVFADSPEKVSGRSEKGNDDSIVTARVIKAIVGAKSEVIVGSPYLIPGADGIAGLKAVRDRGVRVNVITNSLASNDEPFASAAYARYRVPMLKMGVSINEIDPVELRNDKLIGTALQSSIGRSHSKLIVIDSHITFVGSMNMDFRSSRVNTELGLLIDSPELAQDVLTLAAKVRSAGSYRLRLAQPGDRLQWVADVDGVDKVYDSEPEVDLATRLKVFLLFPFVSESLL